MSSFIESTLLSADLSPWMLKLLVLFAKGVLILSATWLMAYALRKSAAAIRFMVWCTGLLSLMALPLISTVLPAWQLEVLPASTAPPPVRALNPSAINAFAPPAPAASHEAPFETPAPEAAAPMMTAAAAGSGFFDRFDYHWTTWAVLVWGIGMLVLMVRLLLAHAGAALLVRKSEVVHDEDWHLLAERVARRLDIDRFVRLRKSTWTTVPMCVGLRRATIILPENADEWTISQRKTVLYHEMAHVKRKDCLLQLFTQLTSAIYWFNPLVWVAGWQLRIERERACDDLVLTSGINASKYAETLLETARLLKKAEWSTLATVSMARQSQLEGRLLSILDPVRRRSLNRASGILTVIMIACIALPLAIMQPATAQVAPPPEVAELPPLPDLPSMPVPAAAPVLPPAAAIPDLDISISPVVVPRVDIPEIEIPSIESHNDNHGQLHGPTSVDSLTIDQIIRLRKYGVNAEFIQSLKAMGYDDLTYESLISLGKYGANARFIAAMQEAGYDTQTLMDYARMSKYGVSPAFVEHMTAAGYQNISADDLVAMSKYGVNQQLVETLQTYGYADVSIDELVSASKYGVSRQLIETLAEAGFDDLRVSELVSMSKYGVSGELINALARHGYDDVSADELVAASKYGLQESLIASLAEAGYDNLSLSDLVSASKYGVGDRLIASLRKYGYTQIDADDLIAASKYGVSERLLDGLGKHGYSNIPLRDVISMSKYGVDGNYIEEMSETGLDIDMRELIQMRKYGVDASFIKQILETGLEDVTVDQLIDMRKHGVDAEFIRSLRENN